MLYISVQYTLCFAFLHVTFCFFVFSILLKNFRKQYTIFINIFYNFSDIGQNFQTGASLYSVIDVNCEVWTDTCGTTNFFARLPLYCTVFPVCVCQLKSKQLFFKFRSASGRFSKLWWKTGSIALELWYFWYYLFFLTLRKQAWNTKPAIQLMNSKCVT